MALVTLCPGCGTTFRVNSAQLQAYGGEVRCGHCQRIFNGFATLSTVNESTIESPAQFQSRPISEPQAVTEDLAVITNSRSAMDLPVAPDRNPETIEASDNPFDEDKPAEKSWSWGLANVLLLLLLIGQIAYAYRTELTIIAPEIRPYLERYFAFIACTVPYPQDIQQLGIESSDLQKNLTRQPEVTTMRAIISNHALFPQAFPVLQLLLLDVHDQIITSRIFTAQDYLLDQDKSLQFIEPRREIEIRLDFDSSQLNALGYRLQLLYL
ncbi:zinc-ribbon and DUF3426 domain-containing protein [Nitrosomonas sp.]|uniref:zinc-ribbon and DUF3426 domain-containing protein n=1 Tax=Nitrosomonas sp. TaxID=42353 RepID=UPI00374D9723